MNIQEKNFVLSPVKTDVDYEKKGKQVSCLTVPYSRDNSAWGNLLIPIVVINNGVGPTILFIGGVHGGEYEGPISLLKLSKELIPESIQGRIIIIPSLNLPAVMAGNRLSPIDQKDMNRVFPGQKDGTISQVVAHYVHDVLLPKVDVVIDLHAGGYSLNLIPYMSMHYLPDEALTKKTYDAMVAFQAPVSLVMREFTGEGLLDYAVESMGKIFLSAELGGCGILTPRSLEVAKTGIKNILAHFNVVDDEIKTRDRSRIMEIPEQDYYSYSTSDGIYESFFELGNLVRAGDEIGQIHFVEDLTKESKPIIAKKNGILLITRGPGFVKRGDCTSVIARDFR